MIDEQGHFAFAQLPEGQFNLNAAKSRCLSASYGQKAPDRQGTPIRLVDGQQMKNVALRLFTGGVITGTVFDERGEPAMNTQVHALRYIMREGARQLMQVGQATADDRGVYRIHGLLPGKYVVTATASPFGAAEADQTAAAVERAIAGHAATGILAIPTSGGGLVRALVGQPSSEQRAESAERLLTADEVAQALGVTRRWVQRRARRLPFARQLS